MEEKKTVFKRLLEASRKLELDHEQATQNDTSSAASIRAAAESYLERYAAFNGINLEDALASYMKVIRRYMADINAFRETGKYPLELSPAPWEISRCEYDLFLMLTILVTNHRRAIMEEIARCPAQGRALVVGVGSGLELSYIAAADGGQAYDLYINPFAREAFPKWSFHRELYRPSEPSFGTIYAIELLEHLADPYDFMGDCHASLCPGGCLVATTAANVPQFDHLYNFVSDDDFESRASALGFALERKRVIAHDYANTTIGARNVFYVLRKA